MTKGWHGNKFRHSLASRGIKTKSCGINYENRKDYKKLERLVESFRKQMEDDDFWEDDKTIFKGMCLCYSDLLVKYLKEHGYKNVYRVGGYYTDVSDDFDPDVSDWDLDELEYFWDNFDNTWKHWWVEVDNKWIVDVTADQFHPGEEDEYKIFIGPLKNIEYYPYQKEYINLEN